VCSRPSQFSERNSAENNSSQPLAQKIALFFDYPEEKWESMDLCAQMLYAQLQVGFAAKPPAGKPDFEAELQPTRVCPPFRPRWQRLPKLGQHPAAFNLDRLVNRLWDYPQAVKALKNDFDYFHVCDHSYAALVHALPAERTGVYCHDIDAFRSVLTPDLEPRPAWYQTMSRHILAGLQKAAVVFYSTEAVRAQIDAFGMIAPERLVHAPYGTSAEFTAVAPTPDSAKFQAWWPGRINAPYLLHVGSCIPRKRIDVLLDVFAQLRPRYPEMQLVKVGGVWSPEQQAQIAQHQLAPALVHLQDLERSQLAALYRQASVVLQPSDAEGFGLPLIEALACGATVIASDIPVLREVGGDGVLYCPVADLERWVTAVSDLLSHPEQAPSPSVKQAQANCYSWQNHAQIIAQAYRRMIA
jgi:glycosyltransferase involved in cell wall biosynthesis